MNKKLKRLLHKSNIFLIIITLFFIGCAKPQITSHSAVVILKTKGFRVYDTAFVKQADKDISIEVYKAGVLSFTLFVGNMICINKECMDEEEFSAKFLNPYYPKKFLRDLFNKKILNFKNSKVIKLQDGFKQIAKTKNYDILYISKNNSIFFKDKLNHILISCKKSFFKTFKKEN